MSSDYAEADTYLHNWAERHGLYVLEVYKDEEVRSVDIVDDQGQIFQVWLKPTEGGSFDVHAWDYKSRRERFDAPADGLGKALEAAYGQVEDWIKQDGHTRTPV